MNYFLYTFQGKALSLFIQSVATIPHLDVLGTVPMTTADVECDYYVTAGTCTKRKSEEKQDSGVSHLCATPMHKRPGSSKLNYLPLISSLRQYRLICFACT
jgi:hypothetical protein